MLNNEQKGFMKYNSDGLFSYASNKMGLRELGNSMDTVVRNYI